MTRVMLADMAATLRSRQWIERNIRHESYDGVTTWHACDCGRGQCRSVQCAECWRAVLAELERGGT